MKCHKLKWDKLNDPDYYTDNSNGTPLSYGYRGRSGKGCWAFFEVQLEINPATKKITATKWTTLPLAPRKKESIANNFESKTEAYKAIKKIARTEYIDWLENVGSLFIDELQTLAEEMKAEIKKEQEEEKREAERKIAKTCFGKPNKVVYKKDPDAIKNEKTEEESSDLKQYEITYKSFLEGVRRDNGKWKKAYPMERKQKIWAKSRQKAWDLFCKEETNRVIRRNTLRILHKDTIVRTQKLINITVIK